MASWRSALRATADRSGWVSRNSGDDAKLIVEIVDYISYSLNIKSSKANRVVGMDSHIGNMNSLLGAGVDDVRVVGIWGMGGIGKTTIARAVYDSIACGFEASCFLENVNDCFRKNGNVHMQEILLSRLLKVEVQNLSSSHWDSSVIWKRLRSKRVLLVLDDVDDLAQVEALCSPEVRGSFGGGSRIIITSRDKSILEFIGANAIYEPKLLSYYGALELFKQHAFSGSQPTKDHLLLASRAMQYTQGLPLAVIVLGSYLRGRSLSEWKAALKKIKEVPPTEIQMLKTSFDVLEDSEKKIFLDIACFFKGMKVDYATKVLGIFAQIGLRVLADRALVTILEDGTLQMHDLLVEMGRAIVRQESITEPGKRSRLWSYEDVLDVLTQNMATEAVESITLDLSNSKEPYKINPEAFGKMKNLRLLNIRDQHHIIQYNDIDVPVMKAMIRFRKLRCLIWHGCPLESIPYNFYSEHLVDLDMQHSCCIQLQNASEPMTELAFVNLSHCEHLKETPNFSVATNLEKLILDGCFSLIEVHPSISFLENLVFLSLRECKELRMFPSRIYMKSLETLNLSGCLSLQNFPDIVGVMEKLSELYLGGTAIRELPQSIGNLTGLVTLSLEDCRELEALPSCIFQIKSLANITLSGCTNLKGIQDPAKHE